MKKISIAILTLLVVMSSCKKVPEVNLKYVDVERDLITVGTTTATVQCDYQYIATLKKAYLYYGEGENETNMNTAEMRVVQNTLYVDLTGLKGSTTYSYYYEFHNGFNSMRTALKSFKTEAGNSGGEEPPTPPEIMLPTVVTALVTEITTNSAQCGGEVVNDGGAEVTERGICWSTNENPTLDDNHVAAGSGIGNFTAAMSELEANTVYHVRAYAINEAGTAYGLDREFKTTDGGGCDCGYVDLGLPSGTLWATCNVGATSPGEFGDHFAWGETQPNGHYDWGTYQYSIGDALFVNPNLIKYCSLSSYGYNGFTDNLVTLLPEDDAAKINWGNDWRIPTQEEWQELLANTTVMWTYQIGMYGGLLFTAANGNSIFLPAAGYCYDSNLWSASNYGYYWSSSLYTAEPTHAWCLNFNSSDCDCRVDGYYRHYGHSVRPVCGGNTPTPSGSVPEGAINGLFTINENGDQVYFSQGNLQYTQSTQTWSFMEHQYDMVERDEQELEPDYADQDVISLFGWGTSGYNHGAVCYQPWCTNNNNNNYYLYGNYVNNLYDQTGKADWGYNKISNGGNTENTWRTLTHSEWVYIIKTRETASGFRCAKAKVNNVNGMLLLPDNWNSNSYILNHLNSGDAPYSVNIISLSEWTVLENAGVVFLPASGTRTMTSVYFVGSDADYWSASYKDDELACTISFGNYNIILETGCSDRSNGKLVRLVQDANP